MHGSKLTMNRRAIPVDAIESVWQAEDGWPIRRIDWLGGASPRGSMLFLPGRGDHYEKYLETLAYFAAQGWQVTSIDWAWTGCFGKIFGRPPSRTYRRFFDVDRGFAFLLGEVESRNPGPHVLLAHSMGGHLAMRALVEKAIDPMAVAMSAPMLGIQTGGLPLALNHAFAKLMCKMGRGDVAAWKVSEKPLSPMNLRAKILTHDDDRYEDEIAWWGVRPEVKLGPPSWHWVERAIASIRLLDEPGRLEAVTTPVLLMATTADQLVSTPTHHQG